MDFTKHTMALVILQVIGKQQFADFYNGAFEDFISGIKEETKDEKDAHREKIVDMIKQML